MPVVVNPGFVLPPDVDPVMSPDGRVTAIVDPSHAGVLLRADYSADQAVAQVRFERGDGTTVRSGDPAWAPGGWAHAYDHESALGSGMLWRAVPIHFDGTEGTPSEYVCVALPDLTDGWAWFKSATDPSASIRLRVEPPDFSYDGRVDATPIAGAPRPAATWDVLHGHVSELRALVRDRATESALMRILDSGAVLAQFPSCAGIADFYFIRDKVNLEHVHWDGYPWRRFAVTIIEVDRPTAGESPLRIPELSYDSVARDWGTYDQIETAVETYNRLLERW